MLGWMKLESVLNAIRTSRPPIEAMLAVIRTVRQCSPDYTAPVISVNSIEDGND